MCITMGMSMYMPYHWISSDLYIILYTVLIAEYSHTAFGLGDQSPVSSTRIRKYHICTQSQVKCLTCADNDTTCTKMIFHGQLSNHLITYIQCTFAAFEMVVHMKFMLYMCTLPLYHVDSIIKPCLEPAVWHSGSDIYTWLHCSGEVACPQATPYSCGKQ